MEVLVPMGTIIPGFAGGLMVPLVRDLVKARRERGKASDCTIGRDDFGFSDKYKPNSFRDSRISIG